MGGKWEWEPVWVVGIDPGANFGMTIINGNGLLVLWGHLPKQEHSRMYGDEAIKFVDAAVEQFGIDWRFTGAVEGAAFKKNVGQVGLAEVRFGFWYGLKKAILTDVIPPMTARKTAFGNGKTQAMDIWPLLNHNAADSIGLALAATKIRNTGVLK